MDQLATELRALLEPYVKTANEISDVAIKGGLYYGEVNMPLPGTFSNQLTEEAWELTQRDFVQLGEAYAEALKDLAAEYHLVYNGRNYRCIGWIA